MHWKIFYTSKANIIVKSIALTTSDAMVTNDDSYIVEHIQKVLDDSDEIEFAIFTRIDGLSIYNERLKWTILEKLPENLASMNTDQIQTKIIKSNFVDKEIYYFSYPIIFSGIDWGWVSIGLSLDQYNRNMQSIYKDSLLLILALLVSSIFFSYMITRWLVKPILVLNSAAKKIALGDLGVKVDISQKGEIGELSYSFNHMVDALKKSDMQLRSYNDELEKRVEDRTRSPEPA